MVSSFLFFLSFNLKWFLPIVEKGQSVAADWGYDGNIKTWFMWGSPSGFDNPGNQWWKS